MSSSGKEGVLKIRDSAGYEWEEVKSPSPPPAPSSENAHLIPPEPAAEPRQLCGYLSKATKGPIKTWKSRWFVFEDQRCRLYYYNSRNDFTPQGYINISNGLFSYSVEEASKCQFEIRADGRVHLLQASSKEAMSYWLNQLQGRRRKFSKHRRKDSCKDRSAEVTFVGGASSVGGSTMRDGSSEEEELNGISEDVVPLELQEQKKSPHTGSGPSRTRLSFKRLFRPTLTPPTVTGSQASAVYHSPNTQRRSNFYLDPPGKESSTSDSEAPSSTEPTSTAPPTAPAVNNSSSVADTTRSTPISLSRKLFNKVTRHSQVSAENDCLHCQMAKEKIDELECELCRKEQEVKDRDEINEFLRNEIRMSDMKMKVKEELVASASNAAEDKKVDILLQRDQTISELQRLLEDAVAEKERVTTEVEAKNQEVLTLAEQVDLYTEAVRAKDHVVMELTNKLFQLENDGQLPADPNEAMRPATTQTLELELQRMKEAVEAYKKQNQFLSAELLEMNHLRTDDITVNKQLVDDFHELEAKFIQQESKYLVLLRESQEPRRGSDAVPSALVSQMVEEAIEQDDRVTFNKDRSGSYDMYGFSHSHHDTLQGDDDLLRIRVRKNELHANRVLDDMDAQHKLQWEILWSQSVGTRHLQRSTQLKLLIRKGIPREYRRDIWKWKVKDWLKESYIPGMYSEIMKKHVDQKSVAQNQIELDLLRTLPTHRHYKADGEWIDKLRRVLVAFSWYDTSIGYCQGLNRLAAVALLFLEEEDAFWCLVAIVHRILPRNYYDRSLLGSQADQRVLKDILKERAPTLTQHLANCDIDFSLITFNWFHTIFVDTMPSDTMMRIWDTFLYEGSKVLFRYAIAIFLYNQEDLLSEDNSISIFNKLRSMCKEATDVKRLTEIAFNEITRFSMDTIRKKRDHYHRLIKSEQDHLERLRSAVIPLNKEEEEVESEEELCEP